MGLSDWLARVMDIQGFLIGNLNLEFWILKFGIEY